MDCLCYYLRVTKNRKISIMISVKHRSFVFSLLQLWYSCWRQGSVYSVPLWTWSPRLIFYVILWSYVCRLSYSRPDCLCSLRESCEARCCLWWSWCQLWWRLSWQLTDFSICLISHHSGCHSFIRKLREWRFSRLMQASACCISSRACSWSAYPLWSREDFREGEPYMSWSRSLPCCCWQRRAIQAAAMLTISWRQPGWGKKCVGWVPRWGRYHTSDL